MAIRKKKKVDLGEFLNPRLTAIHFFIALPFRVQRLVG